MNDIATSNAPRTAIYAPEDVVRANPLRALTDEEKSVMDGLRVAGQTFHDAVAALGQSRELTLAKTKIEEAVMWAVKHVTR